MKILGKQNTPCGRYDDSRDILCDTVFCKRIKTDSGVWHLHRYFKILDPHTLNARGRIFTKIGWSANLKKGEG